MISAVFICPIRKKKKYFRIYFEFFVSLFEIRKLFIIWVVNRICIWFSMHDKACAKMKEHESAINLQQQQRKDKIIMQWN